MKLKKRLKLSAMTVFLAMLLGFAVMSIGTEQAFAMEWNETDNRYEISNYNDLKEFADIVNGTNGATQNRSACAILTADIECDDELWVPIGTFGKGYAGTFDGCGYVIKKLSNGACDEYYQGLFGCIANVGTVQNVGLVDVYITGDNYVGGVAGWNAGTIINCYNTGNVSGKGYYIGGVAGHGGGTITNCFNAGEVSGADDVGGVAGDHWNGTITNCYNTGEVNGDLTVGGVAGDTGSGTITNCYNTGDVIGEGSYIGGVAGGNTGTITKNCYNTGTVSGSNEVGGVVGNNENGTITNCYNTGNVSGDGKEIGGVIGDNRKTVTNCYNTGNVSGTGFDIGGVAGGNTGTITNCYNTGNVSGSGDDVGGVAGWNNGTITKCYYDSLTSGVVRAIGFSDDDDEVAIGLETTDMTGTDCTAYDNWEDFSKNWYLTDEYPLLSAFVYTAVWLNGDETVLDSKVYLLGESPFTEKTSTRDTEAGNTYTFDKWDNGTLVDKTKTYRPLFTVVHNHKYEDWTRLDENQHQRVCEYDATHVEKANHTWDAGKVTTPATTTATGVKTYTCTNCKTTKTETIPKLAKKANPLKVKAKTATVKYKKLKKKNQTLAASKVIKFTKKGQGKITYTKASGNKKITINKKTGKVTVKKGLKKGTYKVKVKVKTAGNANYKASAWKTVTFKIKVK